MTAPRTRAALVLLFVFAAGVLAGIALDRHHLHPTTAPSLATMAEHEAAMAELREVLELDDEQAEQIHALFVDRQEIVQQMWEQLRPEVQAAMREVHLEITALLRPEQRQAFHDWLLRQRQQHRSDNTH